MKQVICGQDPALLSALFENVKKLACKTGVIALMDTDTDSRTIASRIAEFSEEDQRPTLLFLHDYHVHRAMGIFADHLIHADMPKSKQIFAMRFLALRRGTVLETESRERFDCTIVLDLPAEDRIGDYALSTMESSIPDTPTELSEAQVRALKSVLFLFRFLSRINCSKPQILAPYATQLFNYYTQPNLPFCEHLLTLGRCHVFHNDCQNQNIDYVSGRHCQSRHSFLRSDSHNRHEHLQWIAGLGRVMVWVSEVVSPVHYRGRIMGSNVGEANPGACEDFNEFRNELNAYGKNVSRTGFSDSGKSVGQIRAVYVQKLQSYVRVKVAHFTENSVVVGLRLL